MSQLILSKGEPSSTLLIWAPTIARPYEAPNVGSIQELMSVWTAFWSWRRKSIIVATPTVIVTVEGQRILPYLYTIASGRGFKWLTGECQHHTRAHYCHSAEIIGSPSLPVFRASRASDNHSAESKFSSLELVLGEQLAIVPRPNPTMK